MATIDRTAVLTLGFRSEHLPEQAKFSLDYRAVLAQAASFLEALSAGHEVGTVSYLVDGGSGVAATGTVTLSSTTGTAASGTVTLAGGAGNVTIVTDGTSVGPVAFNTSDAQTALDCITALNANATFAAKATASSGGSAVVLITWDTKGTVGNTKTLTASRTAGTATASGATLASGADNAVTVTINGVAVATNTTTAADDTAAAVLVAASINNSANALVNQHVTATSALGVVTLTHVLKSAAGNATTLSSSATSGTATASGARLTGGVTATANTVTV